MTIPSGFRAYEQLRDFVESIGGTMKWRRGGRGGGGTWVLELWGKTKEIRVPNDQINELDKLYIPKVKSPTTWQDYDSPGTLVNDVFWKLVKLFLKKENASQAALTPPC